VGVSFLYRAFSLSNRECLCRGGKCQAEEEATGDVARPMDIKIHTSKGHHTYQHPSNPTPALLVPANELGKEYGTEHVPTWKRIG
jgi:hypothetical protein